MRKTANALLVLLCMLACLNAGFAEPVRPSLELQRSAAQVFIAPGEQTTLAYRVENTGNVPVQSVQITDEICGKIGYVESLAPGEYRAFQKEISVLRPCRSVPFVTWLYDGMTYERLLAPLALAPAQSGMQAEFLFAPENGVPCVRVENTGNTSITAVCLIGDTIGTVFAPEGIILPGETGTVQLHQLPTVWEACEITVQAQTEAGETLCIQLPLALPEAEPDGPAGELLLQVASVQGTRAELRITNTGGRDIPNVRVCESAGGMLRTLSCVPPGETLLQVRLARPAGALQFYAQYASPEPNADDSADESLTTVLAAPWAGSAGKASPAPLWQSTRLGTEAYAVLMYAGISVLVLLVSAVTAHIARKQRKKRKKRERKERRFRSIQAKNQMREEEWMVTRPHLAVKPNAKRKKPTDKGSGEDTQNG